MYVPVHELQSHWIVFSQIRFERACYFVRMFLEISMALF
jgi:hypothetical protein